MNSNAGVDLDKLQKRFDEFFANERPETFWAFVEKKRQQEQPYWKQRCEAAEDVLDSLGVNETLSTHRFKDAPYFKEEIENWKRLKSSPSPTPEKEKEVQAEWEFLIIMSENYEAAKRGAEEDFSGTTKKEAVIETYEDLIEIIKNLPLKRSGREQEVIDYVNNLPQPSTPVQEGLREDENYWKNQYEDAVREIENLQESLKIADRHISDLEIEINNHY